MPGASSVDPDAEDKKVPSFGSSDAKSPRLDDEDSTKQRNHSASSVLSLSVQPRAVGLGGIRWLMSMRLLWKLIRKYFGVILLHSGRRRKEKALLKKATSKDYVSSDSSSESVQSFRPKRGRDKDDMVEATYNALEDENETFAGGINSA
ncbi:hypothetical protein V6N11_081220 [Hibiscus sabdariffa]|uniref:Uncharacterized protein n=1 Tax=Hibiscus sabdariffa TaxID=183260 RepID=A0ABR2QJ82_9ROSI